MGHLCLLSTSIILAVAGCSTSGSSSSPKVTPSASETGPAPSPAGRVPLLAEVTLPTGIAGERDGSSDSPPTPQGPELTRLASATSAGFRGVPDTPVTAHPLTCDLLGFGGSIYVSHAVSVIDKPGARIHRYDPRANRGERWSLALDWDRPKATGAWHDGGGEGFTRLRIIDGRIFAADADTPGPGGFHRSTAPYEDYLFVSDKSGRFPAPIDGLLPPANSRVAPRAFHVFDAIRYGGALVASGGTGDYPTGPYPGALFVGELSGGELPARFEPGTGVGVVRTTYLHRFGGRLYMGFQNNGRRARWDLGVLSGDPRADHTPPPVLARVTEDGGWLTLRFASSARTLYWVASGYHGDGRKGTLFESSDGKRFNRVVLPADSGAVNDIAIVGDTRYVLTTVGLYRSSRGGGFSKLADAPAGDPFGYVDQFCSAPLIAYGDALWAGSTRDGRIYRVIPDSGSTQPATTGH